SLAGLDLLVAVLGLEVLVGVDAFLVGAVCFALGGAFGVRIGAFALLLVAFALLFLHLPGDFGGLLVALVGDVGLLRELLAQVEVGDDRPRHPREGGLVVDGVGQPVQVAAGLGLDLCPVAVDQGLGAVGRRIAGQALPDHQAQNVGHRRRGGLVE